jgi:diguanylate cyclase (GGDEF)-like protein
MVGNETEQLLRLQTEILEAVARGEPLTSIGKLLCLRAEHFAPDAVCSILQIDDAGALAPLAAESLPEQYSEALRGIRTGPKSGSCGTAAFRNAEVVVTDVETDPLWEDYRQLILPLGFKACWSTPIRNPAGKVIATFGFYFRQKRGPSKRERDVVEICVHLCALAIEHERMKERNFRLAYYDALTGLPDRGRFNQLLSEQIERGRPFGLILLDIDHLKAINDTIGHAAGDRLIATVGKRLTALHEFLVPCRLGGDEFAIIARGCEHHEMLTHWAGLLSDAVTGLVEMAGQTFEAHVTMGGAVFGIDGVDADTLCQNADFALYHAKESHRGGYLAFHSELRTEMTRRISLIRQLDHALGDGQVEPFYQPLVDLETGQIIGAEALARLRIGDRIVAAGEFNVALTDPRLAYDLTGQMLEQVAKDMRAWLDSGVQVQHVGVNVTTGDFGRGDLAQRIMEIFGEARVPLHHIVLEVSESVYMGGNDMLVPHAVEELRRQGLRVALDDFGTGFASLTHLMSFPVDIIKIDRSFITALGIDRQSDTVVSGLIDITRKLGMQTVAEGIERAEQEELLRSLGCDYGQGYLYSRPISAEDYTRLLKECGQGLGDGAGSTVRRLRA